MKHNFRDVLSKNGSLVFVCRVGLCGWAKANVPFAGKYKIELKCAVGK
jgi:hypothetical protein